MTLVAMSLVTLTVPPVHALPEGCEPAIEELKNALLPPQRAQQEEGLADLVIAVAEKCGDTDGLLEPLGDLGADVDRTICENGSAVLTATFEWWLTVNGVPTGTLADVGTAVVSNIGGGFNVPLIDADGAIVGVLSSAEGPIHFPKLQKSTLPGENGSAWNECSESTGLPCHGGGWASVDFSGLVQLEVHVETVDLC